MAIGDAYIGNYAQETTSTTGTGTYTLDGPAAGFQSIAAAIAEVSGLSSPWSNVLYHVTDGTDHEIGLGTLTDLGSDTLSRDTILESTNGNSEVDWGAGNKTVIHAPAGHLFANYKSRIEAAEDSISGMNLIYNPNFAVAQRGTLFTSTTAPIANNNLDYIMDRWYILADNDTIDISRGDNIFGTNVYFYAKLEVETANKKFGIAQILEAETCRPLRGQTVSLSFKAWTTTGKVINNIRAAILSWTGTPDSPTQAIFTAYGSSGSNPTLATSWNYDNTPGNLAPGIDTWSDFAIENITINANCNNIAVAIWCDDTDAAVDDVVYITNVKLEKNATVTPYVNPVFTDELERCLRYFQRYPGNLVSSERIATGQATSTTNGQFLLHLQKEMRVSPSSVYSAVGTFLCIEGGSTLNPTNSIATQSAGKYVITINIDHGSALFTLGAALELCRDVTDTSYIYLDSELGV